MILKSNNYSHNKCFFHESLGGRKKNFWIKFKRGETFSLLVFSLSWKNDIWCSFNWNYEL
jgi:hypothetical protein